MKNTKQGVSRIYAKKEEMDMLQNNIWHPEQDFDHIYKLLVYIY